MRAHGLIGSGFVLPVALAEDWGRLVLAFRLLLQIVSGFALLRLARLIGLGSTGLLGAVLVESDPGFVGGTPGALVGTVLVMLAVERCVSRAGVLALAGAVGTLAFLASGAAAFAGLCLGAGWGVVRLATGLTGRRLSSSLRLACGFLVGALIASPALAAHVLSTLAAGSPALGDLAPLLSGATAGLVAAARVRPVLDTLVPLLAALALAILALVPVPPPRRAVPLRVLLAFAAVGAAMLPGTAAILRVPLALLATVALADARRGAASGLVARLTAVGLVLALALAIGLERGVMPGVPLLLASAASASLVVLASRPFAAGLVTASASVAGIVGAAYGLTF